MASAATITGILLIVGLIGIGVTQAVLEQAPGAALVGAVTAPAVASPEPLPPTQQELNLCMNGCMDGCVKNPGDQQPCIQACETECGARR